MRFFLTLSYKGTAYNGWQIQPDAPSVQETLQRALSTILRAETEVVGAGRTDTGVHAADYVAHFDTESEAPLRQADDFRYHLNALLPGDIAVSGVRRVKDDAHARFSATRREYKYYVVRQKDPFRRDTAICYSGQLDVGRMNEAAAIVRETEDFTSFCKLHGNNKTNLCRIVSSHWAEEGGALVYTVSADRFLRNMVRALVGTMLDTGRGKLDTAAFRAVIAARRRGAAGTSAPPQGLFLTAVDYPDEVYECGIER
jgi:tRNA pseudouridine38-40 synthase